MSFLKQIEDKGAVLDWSPISGLPNVVALGTKVEAILSKVLVNYLIVF